MKKKILLSFLALIAATTCYGQASHSASLKSTNDYGVGMTFIGATRIGQGSIATNLAFVGTSDGSQFTNLNAGNISAGTISLARLPSTVTTNGGTLTGMLKGNGARGVTAATAATDFVPPGLVTLSGLTMSTAKILGRTTATTGTPEEISVGTGLTLSAGSLSLADLSGTYQPLDSDLTSIASLTTTTAGRTALTITDPNANRIFVWDDTDNVYYPAVIGTGLTYTHSSHTLDAAGGISPTNNPGVGSLLQATVGGGSPVYKSVTNLLTYSHDSTIIVPSKTIDVFGGDSWTATGTTNLSTATERWPVALRENYPAYQNTKGTMWIADFGVGLVWNTNALVSRTTNSSGLIQVSLLQYLTNNAVAGDTLRFNYQSSVNDGPWFTNGGHPYIEVVSNMNVQVKSWAPWFGIKVVTIFGTPGVHGVTWPTDNNPPDAGELMRAYANYTDWLLNQTPLLVEDAGGGFTNAVTTNQIDIVIDTAGALAGSQNPRLFDSYWHTNYDSIHPWWTGQHALAHAWNEGVLHGRQPGWNWTRIMLGNLWWFNPTNGYPIRSLDLKTGNFDRIWAGDLPHGVTAGIGAGVIGSFKAYNSNPSLHVEAADVITTQEILGIYDSGGSSLWKWYGDGSMTAIGALDTTFGGNQAVTLHSTPNTRPFIQIHDSVNGDWFISMRTGGGLSISNLNGEALLLKTNGVVNVPNLAGGGSQTVLVNNSGDLSAGAGGGSDPLMVDTLWATNLNAINLAALNWYATNLFVNQLWATNAYILTNSAPVAPLTNVFLLGTRYTNADQRAFISQSFTLNAAAAGTAAVTLLVEQGNAITNKATISAGPLASFTAINQLSMFLSPQARYTFTDATSGSGATVTAVTNTASWIGL